MDLTIYDMIQGPRVTEKAYGLNQKLKQLVLQVHPKANKPLIVEALKKLFNVDVEKINIIVSKGKVRRVGRQYFQGKLKKKAIVMLKDGQAIDLMQLTSVAGAQESASTTGTEK